MRSTHVHDVDNDIHWRRFDLTPDLSVSLYDDSSLHIHHRHVRYLLTAGTCPQGVYLTPQPALDADEMADWIEKFIGQPLNPWQRELLASLLRDGPPS